MIYIANRLFIIYLKKEQKKELENCSKQCKFSAAWHSEFLHLEYSVSKDAAYCFVCSLFPEGPGRASADPA